MWWEEERNDDSKGSQEGVMGKMLTEKKENFNENQKLFYDTLMPLRMEKKYNVGNIKEKIIDIRQNNW